MCVCLDLGQLGRCAASGKPTPLQPIQPDAQFLANNPYSAMNRLTAQLPAPTTRKCWRAGSQEETTMCAAAATAMPGDMQLKGELNTVTADGDAAQGRWNAFCAQLR